MEREDHCVLYYSVRDVQPLLDDGVVVIPREAFHTRSNRPATIAQLSRFIVPAVPLAASDAWYPQEVTTMRQCRVVGEFPAPEGAVAIPFNSVLLEQLPMFACDAIPHDMDHQISSDALVWRALALGRENVKIATLSTRPLADNAAEVARELERIASEMRSAAPGSARRSPAHTGVMLNTFAQRIDGVVAKLRSHR
ncbi:MAG: hypothetical protein Q7T01_02485 [bacterium]|nr:hypothetical protein [bacterium]